MGRGQQSTDSSGQVLAAPLFPQYGLEGWEWPDVRALSYEIEDAYLFYGPDGRKAELHEALAAAGPENREVIIEKYNGIVEDLIHLTADGDAVAAEALEAAFRSLSSAL